MRTVRLLLPDDDREPAVWVYPLAKVLRACLVECGKEMARWCWGDFEEPLTSDCFSLLMNLMRHQKAIEDED